jgi:hypothetical protein
MSGRSSTPRAWSGFVWEQTRNGEARWGIAYRADAITAAPSAKAA